MTRDEARELMIDLLGGELEAARRVDRDAYLTGEPELAEELASLERTREAMRSLTPGPAGAAARRDGRRTGRRGWAPFRYAAVAALAFAAGLVVRDQDIAWRVVRAEEPTEVSTPTESLSIFLAESGPTAEAPGVARPWGIGEGTSVRARIARAYAAEMDNRAGLARALVAVANA